MVPEGGVVAAPGIRQLFAIAGDDKRNGLEISDLRFHGRLTSRDERARGGIADDGKEIACGGDRNRHAGRFLLRAFLRRCEPDTFQDDGAGQRLAGRFELSDVRQAAEKVFFLQTKGNETNFAIQWNRRQHSGSFQHHGEAAGIIIGAG